MSEHCVFCGHKHLDRKTTRYIYQKDQQMLVVENVPCLECTFCGEQYFDAGVLQKIENDYLAITHQQRQPRRVMLVAVEDFTALPL
ncbi:MAG: type II toxin-antitoxin system MqsA family antitoxin [Methylococcales bacterium]|nr:type II toxin-antitoxin system MqsA family antitoxin [Methylococcales bacterium]MDD5631585.1 type II toxin-antitoxin system MqsA family antitoxin [Methylococcales bacterium]